MSDKLRELLAFADKQAGEMFKQTGEVLPMWDLEDGEGNRFLAVTPFTDTGNKESVAAIIRRLISDRGIVRYAFLCEAWSAIVQAEDQIPQTLVDHPDRREVLIIFVEERGGATLSRTRYILRPEHGKPTLSPPNDNEAYDNAQGRFMHMFEPEQ